MRFTRHYEVGCHDVDLNNEMKPSIMQRYMMDSADCQMRIRRPSGEDLLKIGKAFIMTRITIDIEKPVYRYDELDGETWNCPAKGASFYRCFELKRDGQTVARGHSAWALIDIESGRICRPSEIDLSNYESEEAYVMDHPAKFKMPTEVEFVQVGTKKVLYSECDQNVHMNNTYYADVLWSYIPDIMKKSVSYFDLRYHHEAALNKVMEIHMGKLSDNEYCFKTFVDGKLNVEAIFGIR